MTFSPHEVACNKSKKGQCEGVAYVNDFLMIQIPKEHLQFNDTPETTILFNPRPPPF